MAASATPHDPRSNAKQIDVVGVASNSAEARSRVAELHPDVVLVDIALGAESGVELARSLARESGPKITPTTTLPEVDFVDLFAAGPAAGFTAMLDLRARALKPRVSADTASSSRR